MHAMHTQARPRLSRAAGALAAWAAISASHVLASPLTVPAGTTALPLPGATAGEHASTATPGAKPSSPKPRKVKAPKMPTPSHAGSAETRAERDQRLRRECRGKPNAGACEGYAS